MKLAEPSAEELDAIRSAVADVESTSGVEVVPVLAAASDAYRLADWRGAALGALLCAAAAPWLPDPAAWSAAGAFVPWGWTLAGALAGAAAARWHPLRLLLAGEGETAQRVTSGAREAFLAHELFRTRDRTGLLVYVSMFERRVEILADEGVYRAVPQTVWADLAGEVAATMRVSPPAAALLAAVRRAGELVAAHGPHRRGDDRNELPDAPVVR